MGFKTSLGESEGDQPLPLRSIRLVAIDIDGTLLDEDGELGDEDRQAIEDAMDRGIHIVLATARPWRSSKKLYRELGLDTLMIVHNGAVVIDALKRRVLFHKRLSGKLATQVIYLARSMDRQLSVGVELLDKFYIRKRETQLGAIAQLDSAKAIVGSLKPVLDGPVTKVAFVGDPGSLGNVQSKLEEIGEGKVSLAPSDLRLLQVLHPDANKAKALEFVCDHYGIQRDEVMAIGDAPNDIPMLEWAGLGVAVENAWPAVKSSAQLTVADNCNNGVAQALNQYAHN